MIGVKRNCFLVALLLGFSFFFGCGKKEDSQKSVKRVAKPADIINVKLKDGTNVKIDAAQFGIKSFPAGDILSYECVPDQRRLMDRLGKPMVQPVYKHLMYMETKASIDSLIQFFFQQTPHLVNRRKYGNSDSYARMVSTKDVNEMRDLKDPYIIIDLKVVYPKEKPKKRLSDLDGVIRSEQSVSPEQERVSYLKSQIKQYNDSLLSPETTIPERRKIHEQVKALNSEISDIEARLDSSKKRRKRIDKNNSVDARKKSKRPLYVKVKILTYSYRAQ